MSRPPFSIGHQQEVSYCVIAFQQFEAKSSRLQAKGIVFQQLRYGWTGIKVGLGIQFTFTQS
ncbi:hypothetical protein CTI14_30750 [Methylobacterium radiotolerans]|nr:hypothetical protein CTI14_30750 [Methylobacterium radiotolerans]